MVDPLTDVPDEPDDSGSLDPSPPSLARRHATHASHAQLNPAALTQRLLESIAPATRDSGGDAAAHHAPLRPTSSLPNLARGHAGGSESPAHLDDDVIEKAHRTNTQVNLVRDRPDAPTRRSTVFFPPVHEVPNEAACAPPRPPLLAPKKPLGKNPSFRQCLVNVARYSLLNVLLVFVPVAWAMGLSHQGPTVTFVMSFFAIVPLAALLGLATEQLALRVGDAFGGLLNATFGCIAADSLSYWLRTDRCFPSHAATPSNSSSVRFDLRNAAILHSN